MRVVKISAQRRLDTALIVGYVVNLSDSNLWRNTPA